MKYVILCMALLTSKSVFAQDTFYFRGPEAQKLEIALLKIAAPLNWKTGNKNINVEAKELVCERDIATGAVDCVHNIPAMNFWSKKAEKRAEARENEKPLAPNETRYDQTKEIKFILKREYTSAFVQLAIQLKLPFVEEEGKQYLLIHVASCSDVTIETDSFKEALSNRRIKSCNVEMDLDKTPDLKMEMKLRIKNKIEAGTPAPATLK